MSAKSLQLDSRLNNYTQRVELVPMILGNYHREKPRVSSFHFPGTILSLAEDIYLSNVNPELVIPWAVSVVGIILVANYDWIWGNASNQSVRFINLGLTPQYAPWSKPLSMGLRWIKS